MASPTFNCMQQEKMHGIGCMVSPPQRCYKINIDGSHRRNSGNPACGGLIRDSNEIFVKGFFGRVGYANVLWAKLQALGLGIKLAKQMNLKWASFEMDSKVVMNMVHSGITGNAFLQPMLQEAISLLQLPLSQIGELWSIMSMEKQIGV